MAQVDEWIVQAWRDRGILASDSSAVITREDLTAMHSSSWFVRRNRKAPFSAAVRAAAGQHRGCRAGEHSSMRRQSSFIEASIQSRLPQGVRPLKANPANLLSSSSTEVGTTPQCTASSMNAGSTTTAESCAYPHHERQGELLEYRAANCDHHQQRPDVFLTLYDLCACCNAICAHWLGMGVYHSGILMRGIEYTFDNIATAHGSGVIAHEPYYNDPERSISLPLRAKLLLGQSRLSAQAAHEKLLRLAPLWKACSYDIVEHNCHHWSCTAAKVLGVQPPPPWVFRSTELLRFFSGIDMPRQAKSSLDRTVPPRERGSRINAVLSKGRDKLSPRDRESLILPDDRFMSESRSPASHDDDDTTDDGCQPLIAHASGAV